MIGAFALLLLSGAAAQPAEIPKRASPEVAVSRVKACGFDHVRVKDDPELQEDVVEVSGVTTVRDAQMRCVVEASLDTIYYVEFPEPASKAYWQLYFKSEDERDQGRHTGWMQGSARDWVQQHRLSGKVPRYEKGGDDLQFGRQLERLCGPKAKGIFALFDGHVVMEPKPPTDFETVLCLVNVTVVSGMPIGFVGNENYEKR